MFAFELSFIRVITVLFFVGMAGSAIVVAIAFVEDFRELFSSDDPVQELEQTSSASQPSHPHAFAHSYMKPAGPTARTR
jgi:hypothetical protein